MDVSFAGVAIVPLVVGLSEILKRFGLNIKFVPIVNLVMGLAIGILLLNPTNIRAGMIQGLFIGLSASGLYSGVKNVMQGIISTPSDGTK